MYDFNYHRPAALKDAKKILDENEDAKIIAGGMTLIPTMKLRLAQPTDLVDISGIEELTGISKKGKHIEIGAMTTHADVAANDLVLSKIPALAELADDIGDAQVRNRGTLGGSVANSDPAADYPAAILGLNATVKTDSREIAADDFFIDLFETALTLEEIVRSVIFPIPVRAGYAKFPNPASRYAIAGVMVVDTGDGVRVAVTGAGPCAFRVPEMEAALDANFSVDALDGISIDAGNLNGDLHASPEYRAHLVTVMARRAVQAAGG